MREPHVVIESPVTLDLRGQLPHEQEANLVAFFDSLTVGEAVVVTGDGLLGLLHLRLDEIRPGQADWAVPARSSTGDVCVRLTRMRSSR
jgi:hypothetical protein